MPIIYTKEYITLFGVVEPIKTVYLDAVEGGRVEEVFLENGTIVQQTVVQSMSQLS